VFGTLLTTEFALAALYLRDRLENELINQSLQSEVDSFVAFKREHPEPDANYEFDRFVAGIYARHRFANIPLEWRHLGTGIHDLDERQSDGSVRHYKLAVRDDGDLRGFLRYDVTQEELGKRQMIGALAGALVLFTDLASSPASTPATASPTSPWSGGTWARASTTSMNASRTAASAITSWQCATTATCAASCATTSPRRNWASAR